MTCGCARQAETLKQLGCDMEVQYEGDSQESRARYSRQYRECMDSRHTQYFIGQLRCDPNGNFDTAQCISQVSHEPQERSEALPRQQTKTTAPLTSWRCASVTTRDTR